ncbi:MAG: DUF1929 domain-containing protein [Acidobacteria bacterium]|nr:DUF1929 domain-containing protein [Acidobacteriota bacterium]
MTGGRLSGNAAGPIINFWFNPFDIPLSDPWHQKASLHNPITCEPMAPNPPDNPAVDCIMAPSGQGYDCTGNCLNGGRYYPTNISLTTTTPAIADAILTMSGVNKGGQGNNNSVERFNPDLGNDGTWDIISKNIPIDRLDTNQQYPRLHLFPDGYVFYSGSDPQTQLFNPNLPSTDPLQWQLKAMNRCERVHGISVLLPFVLAPNGLLPNGSNDPGAQVLVAGGHNHHPGNASLCPLLPPNNAPTVQKTADVYNYKTDTWDAVADMTMPRDMHQAVLLPDGKVVILGGEDKVCVDIVNDCPGTTACEPVYTGDLYNPITKTWTQIPAPPISQQRPRQYHSGAILLPDASVLVDGGETDYHCYSGMTAQIYKPGYFFRPTARPVFHPTNPFPNGNQMIYGQAFTINAPNADQIAKVVLIRSSSVTHSFNPDQRYLELYITSRPQGNSSLVVMPPANQNLAPLGYYMLFLVKETTPGNIDTRISSVAKFVQLVTPTFQQSLRTRPRR